MRYLMDKKIEQKRELFFNSSNYNGLYAYDGEGLINRSTRKKVAMVLETLPSGKKLEVLDELNFKVNKHGVKSVIYDHITGAPRLLQQTDGSIHEYNEFGDYLQGNIQFISGKVANIGGVYKSKEGQVIGGKKTMLFYAVRKKFKEYIGRDYDEYQEDRVPELKTFTTLGFNIYY